MSQRGIGDEARKTGERDRFCLVYRSLCELVVNMRLEDFEQSYDLSYVFKGSLWLL